MSSTTLTVTGPTSKKQVTSQSVTFHIPMKRWTPSSTNQRVECIKTVEIKGVNNEKTGKWSVELFTTWKHRTVKLGALVKLLESATDLPVNADFTAAVQRPDGSLSKRSVQKRMRATVGDKIFLDIPFDNVYEWTPEFFVQFEMYVEFLSLSSAPPPVSPKPTAMEVFMKETREVMYETLLNLVSSTTPKWIKVVSSDGQDFKANRDILVAQSSYLKTVVQGLTQKKGKRGTGIVVPLDVPGNATKILLELWQTGELDESWREPGVIEHLASAAHKYGIKSLKNLLNNTIGDEKTTSNAFELLQVASDTGLEIAEEKLLQTVTKGLKSSKTRDELVATLGLNQEVFETQGDKELAEMMNAWWNGEAEGKPVNEGLMELLHFAADKGYHVAEKKLVASIANKAGKAKTAQELFTALGVSRPGKDSPGEPPEKRMRLDLPDL